MVNPGAAQREQRRSPARPPSREGRAGPCSVGGGHRAPCAPRVGPKWGSRSAPSPPSFRSRPGPRDPEVGRLALRRSALSRHGRGTHPPPRGPSRPPAAPLPAGETARRCVFSAVTARVCSYASASGREPFLLTCSGARGVWPPRGPAAPPSRPGGRSARATYGRPPLGNIHTYTHVHNTLARVHPYTSASTRASIIACTNTHTITTTIASKHTHNLIFSGIEECCNENGFNLT